MVEAQGDAEEGTPVEAIESQARQLLCTVMAPVPIIQVLSQGLSLHLPQASLGPFDAVPLPYHASFATRR